MVWCLPDFFASLRATGGASDRGYSDVIDWTEHCCIPNTCLYRTCCTSKVLWKEGRWKEPLMNANFVVICKMWEVRLRVFETSQVIKPSHTFSYLHFNCCDFPPCGHWRARLSGEARHMHLPAVDVLFADFLQVLWKFQWESESTGRRCTGLAGLL